MRNLSHALAVQKRLIDFYIPQITSITYEGQHVEAPEPVLWYPDKLAWFMTTPKNVVRRFPPFASFQKFLVAETDVGNISRQEVVSMIPPLVMDIKPGMTVLDLCAAPGSKSAQIIELIHAGEEERARTVAKHLANGLDRPKGEEYQDDGRPTGLLVANDVDYKRAHMLVHQMKRLNSPNLIVTNHDATIFPSIRLPYNRYLRFDRILADVPCSGDGTARKNLEIWTKWTPSNGLGLHVTQVKILIRALQMLKIGGRVVYSTCSMNPVEDEAVVAAAIDRCGGLSRVDIVETKDYLPGLRRYPGLRKWKVMDKVGRTWSTFQEVLDQRGSHGDEGLGRLQESMFPPREDLPLERCIRVYAHQQNTGAFFIAILEKKSEIRVRPEEKASSITITSKPDVAVSGTTRDQIQTSANGVLTVQDVSGADSPVHETPMKRKHEDGEDRDVDSKRRRSAHDESSSAVNHQEAEPSTNGEKETAENSNRERSTSPFKDDTAIQTYKMKKPRDKPFEEPFKYLNPQLEELKRIFQFYKISDRVPRDRFMVRNAQGTASKNIYYTSALAKAILQENERKGMKFVHSGIKMFVKQDVPRPEVCPWRIQTDGLPILESWVGPERMVKLTKRETLRKLLIEMFPKFAGDEWKNLGEIGEQVRDISMGCCVLVVEPTEEPDGLAERMVFPLWKSLHSLNLMLPKEDRKAMLLRLFNDDRPLINLQNTASKPQNPVTKERDPQPVHRNSSSEPEDEAEAVKQHGDNEHSREEAVESVAPPRETQGNLDGSLSPTHMSMGT